MPTARRTTSHKAETRRFGMHGNLLLDVIRRQAGSLAKAILETVMNAVDAGSETCTVTVTDKKVTIEDDGKGMTERREIEEFFEVFGTPHDESENKVYGTFRMGRGQAFAYGKNLWRTGPFEMRVDVKGKGLDYELITGLKPVKGCKIEIMLYDPLLPSDLAETLRTIKKWVRYATTPVVLNGETVSVDPAAEKWDAVTDEAYVRLGTGHLSVYNLGVHTMDLGGYRFGTGGTVVSRKQLRVNFARNDVQSDCPVWKKVRPFLDKTAQTKIERKTQLTDDERQRLCDLITQGEPPEKAKDLKLFTAVTGRTYSARDLRKIPWQYQRTVTHCPQGNRVGDRLFQQKVAFVFADETLKRFDVSIEKLMDLICSLLSSWDRSDFKIIPFRTLAGDLNDSYVVLDDSETTAAEKLWLDLVRRVHDCLAPPGLHRWRRKERRIIVGESTGADGWTDGTTYIAIDRKFLRKQELTVRSFVSVGLLLAHEYCHTGPDTAEHIHGPEFYAAFHDRTGEALHDFVSKCLTHLPQAVARAGKQASRESLRDSDRTARVRQELLKLASASLKE